MSFPSLSVIIPCRNEERFLDGCLSSLFASDYPEELLEVLVIDGMSTDATRAIAARHAARRPRLRILDNPSQVVPAALNLGIRASMGELVMRLDAHSSYPRGYVRACVDLLLSTGAANAGGRFVTVPNGDGAWAVSVARVTSHPFGVGPSRFRVGAAPGFVDTVPYGVFRRSLFDEIGCFDERLTRNQDNEFNARLRRRGHRIAFDPAIEIFYRNQATLAGLARQAWHTGAWNVYTLALHPHSWKPRLFVPAAFVLYLGVLVFGVLIVGPLAWLPLAAYAALAGKAAAGGRDPAATKARTLLGFVAYHCAYGLGTWLGALRVLTGTWRDRLGRPLAG